MGDEVQMVGTGRVKVEVMERAHVEVAVRVVLVSLVSLVNFLRLVNIQNRPFFAEYCFSTFESDIHSL